MAKIIDFKKQTVSTPASIPSSGFFTPQDQIGMIMTQFIQGLQSLNICDCSVVFQLQDRMYRVDVQSELLKKSSA